MKGNPMDQTAGLGRAMRPITVKDRTCVVWLAEVGMQRPSHSAVLNEAEMTRRNTFMQEIDRSRFTLAAALLRLLVAGQTGLHPTDVLVDRTCERCGKQHGRPRLPGTGLHASISHSHYLVGIALTRMAPVGLDIEAIVASKVDDILVQECINEDEPIRSPGDFFTYWCRKELVVKATGEGLYVPLNKVVVSPANEPPRLLSYQGRQLSATIREIELNQWYAGAVTLLGDVDVDVSVRRTADVLDA